MTEEELINIINKKQLNHKTNNYIIKDVCDSSDIISRINKESIIENIDDVKEQDIMFNSDRLINIIVNLKYIDYYNIFNYVLKQLNIDEKVKLETMMNLLDFKRVLRKNNKAIQFIITNPEVLSKEDTKIFNQLLYFNTYFFNSIVFGELNSYEVLNGKILDNRENYTKVSLLKMN